MEKRPENLGEPKLSGITDALKNLETDLKNAILVAGQEKARKDESFDQYMKAEGQEKIEKGLKEKWERELELAEKNLAEFREKAKKYAESDEPADRGSYNLHIKLKEEDIKQLKKLLGR